MDLSAKIYTSSQVADAAEVKLATLQGWLSRYENATKSKHATDGGGKRGVIRYFSFYNVVHFAIAQKLIEGGVDVPLALNAGASFAHFSIAEVEGIERAPGVPFKDPNGKTETLLCVSKKSNPVVPMYDGFDWWKHANMLAGNTPGLFVMPIRNIWSETCWRLGVKPKDVLASAYPDRSGE